MLVAKSMQALDVTGMSTLVVAGGVGANAKLRRTLTQAAGARGARVFFPEPRYCTDNGAMIALVGALRIGEARREYAISVRPRWSLV